jgi:hypothetical protein
MNGKAEKQMSKLDSPMHEYLDILLETIKVFTKLPRSSLAMLTEAQEEEDEVVTVNQG